jgi:hypothetical protein
VIRHPKVSGDCGDHGIEAVATWGLLFAFEIPSEVTGRLSRSHYQGLLTYLCHLVAARTKLNPDASMTASKPLVPPTEFDIVCVGRSLALFRQLGIS